MTLSDLEWQQDFQRHGTTRGLSVTAELLILLGIRVRNFDECNRD